MAKFEVCCHKFADLSEHNYGVSILNDSKYGFATVGNVMRLSLLRSPKAPDGNADMGKHVMRWAIMPHRGALGAATVRAAANLNNPMKIVRRGGDQAAKAAPIRLVGDDNLVLDWIKRAEDDADVCHDASETLKARDASAGKSIVVRVYDALGGFGRGVVESDFPLEKVYKTNVLEDDLEEIAVQASEGGSGKGSSFEIELGSFEIATYRLVLKQ